MHQKGFFGVQDQLHSDELLLMLDYGIFYEFIDMKTYGTQNEKVIPLADVVVGTQYAVIISTNAGLWRYHIGDTYSLYLHCALSLQNNGQNQTLCQCIRGGAGD
jgi:hypothetical protein